MGHLSNVERNKVVAIYEVLNTFVDMRNKCKKVSEIAKSLGIQISEKGVRLIIHKWVKTGMIFCFCMSLSLKVNRIFS